MRNLNACTEKGINALDLIGEKVTTKDTFKAEEFLKMNYGVDYPTEKFNMLWSMIIEEGWTTERLNKTVKWFLKNKKFPNWTIADWFDYSVKLYPYSWYSKKISEGVKAEEMDCYKINGQCFWKLKDGTELPFDKIGE